MSNISPTDLKVKGQTWILKHFFRWFHPPQEKIAFWLKFWSISRFPDVKPEWQVYLDMTHRSLWVPDCTWVIFNFIRQFESKNLEFAIFYYRHSCPILRSTNHHNLIFEIYSTSAMGIIIIRIQIKLNQFVADRLKNHWIWFRYHQNAN